MLSAALLGIPPLNLYPVPVWRLSAKTVLAWAVSSKAALVSSSQDYASPQSCCMKYGVLGDSRMTAWRKVSGKVALVTLGGVMANT